MENKHKHHDMIVAKAANMDLVLFIKRDCNSEWSIISDQWDMSFLVGMNSYQYFLCLPQHKEACLHWLNGGEVQQKHENDVGWVGCASTNKVTWMSWTSFMKGHIEFRIKPKKEKRWIVYRNGTVYGEYLSPEDINDDFKRTGQVIEIEVEV